MPNLFFVLFYRGFCWIFFSQASHVKDQTRCEMYSICVVEKIKCFFFQKTFFQTNFLLSNISKLLVFRKRLWLCCEMDQMFVFWKGCFQTTFLFLKISKLLFFRRRLNLWNIPNLCCGKCWTFVLYNGLVKQNICT